MNRIATTTARTTRLQTASAALLVGLVALTAAAWTTITAPAEGPEVVKLERVVISGVRTPDAVAAVEQLPRVVIEGRRSVDGTQMASADLPVSAR
ncbi:hypothetical protein [Roseateles sp. BYS87W]|uniref:TonB-dependent receptor plug domain-containing protein n=1 Tax=Pelomonas baiyunensis TaxID=3299026 RepID=A0ABW7GZ52_9BURK